MWFLIKATFWFSMVLVLLPFLDPSSSNKLEHAPKVELGDTFAAANEAFQYISAICIQKPEVCEKGAETFVALGHRAREGARIAYEFLDTQFAETDVANPDAKVTTGTVAPVASGTVAPADAATPTAEVSTLDAEPVFKRTPVPEKRLDPKTTVIQ
ncbi:MAG TPA: DUF5330 domain-containing protein [Ensifer sp.]|uniref:DUF5330 domain-containing protein n=1 Tax=Ensifer sp. TaxID=1872086 RepID=UPI002E15C4CB|nr:DUF5330 domain-containing protein [Ensifer sp.]